MAAISPLLLGNLAQDDEVVGQDKVTIACYVGRISERDARKLFSLDNAAFEEAARRAI